MSDLPGADVPMTTEELRDTLAAVITGHSRKDTTDWDINLAMSAVEAHVAYRLSKVQSRLKDEALRPNSEHRFETLAWVAAVLAEEAAGGQTPPTEGEQVT